MIKTILVSLVMVAASSTLWAQQRAKITFTDDFAPGPSQLWNNLDGNWTATAGQYYATVPNYEPLTFTGLPFVLSDYTLTVTTVDGDGGIWLRSQESDPYTHYVLLVIGGDDYGAGERG